METAVYSLNVVIAASAVVLVLGLGVGLLLGRRLSPAGKKQRDVERKLDQVLQDKKAYEDEVVEHFSDTAKLLNQLTASYRDVHHHLAKGASELCQGEGPIPLEQSGNTDQTEIPHQLTEVQAPLDYAPKSSPNEKGMLNETFGLDAVPTPPPEHGRG